MINNMFRPNALATQALPSVAVVLLEDQLLPEAGAGTDGGWRQPAEGHRAGRRQPERHFHLEREVGLPRREGGASRGPPPPAGGLFCAPRQSVRAMDAAFACEAA